MSRSLTNTQAESTGISKTEFNICNEISQSNKNMGCVAEIFRSGVLSGEMSLLDNDNMILFRSFTKNLCDVTTKVMDIASIIPPSSKVITMLPENSDKSSLTNSVHNSDVTSDDGVAQEQTSCRWVSEFAGSSSDEDVVHIVSEQNTSISHNSRKRKTYDTDDSESCEFMAMASKEGKSKGGTDMAQIDNGKGCFDKNNTGESISMQIDKEITSIGQVHDYLSQYPGNNLMKSKNNDIDLVNAVEEIIKLCDNNSLCPYHAQSLVIFEHSTSVITVESDSSNSSVSYATSTGNNCLSVPNYFKENLVTKITVIERPLKSSQVYIAGNLGYKYHFSCPTTEVTFLFDILKQQHNSDLSISFIPRSCQMYASSEITVFNNVERNPLPLDLCHYDDLYDTMNKLSAGGGNKRTSTSISIGLQTMYSHQQHLFRYCMLPHSRPHVPTVKHYPPLIRKAMLDGYLIASELVQGSTYSKQKHPFYLHPSTEVGSDNARYELRTEMYNHLMGEDLKANDIPIDINNMFESCTIQPTARLGFHRDLMNCPSMDKTIALHFPSFSEKNPRCISFLYYSRKSVGNYARRQVTIKNFLHNQDSCPLTSLCLKSLLETEGIFNYQSTMFENSLCLNKLGDSWEINSATACPDIARFTRTPCFKQGAAFDKMGYYSIVINVFLSLHYMGVITTLDDSISFCMYFGLLCNGTSNLAATWVGVAEQHDFAKEWCARKKTGTKVFNLLVFLEKKRRETDNSIELMGSCKLPRFQYANYSAGVIAEANLIHCYVKDFLLNTKNRPTKDSHINAEHARLFHSLSRIKGIGPLSFNQFWHSLSLCGVLPVHYINSTAVAVGSGPANLIQTFYPKCKSADSLLSKLHLIKAKIHNLGISSATDFFLENMMCELTRLGNKSKLASKKMAVKDRKSGYQSTQFFQALRQSKPTKNPDLYFRNPFNDQYQHLFRVVKKDLQVRLSFLDNDISASIMMHCSISHKEDDNNLVVSWSGDYVRRSKVLPSSWFYA